MEREMLEAEKNVRNVVEVSDQIYCTIYVKETRILIIKLKNKFHSYLTLTLLYVIYKLDGNLYPTVIKL